MRSIITSSLQVIAAILITVSAIASAAPIPESSPEPAETMQKVETVPNPYEDVKPSETARTKPEKLIIKPEPVAESPASIPEPVQDGRAPLGVTDRGGSGSCAAEIKKYDWHQKIALAVASAESGLRPGIVNNNPNTGDYSVGCFQVNLFGGNARTRPSEVALRDAAINVKWAYNNYVANGRSFIGQWGVCNSKVACR